MTDEEIFEAMTRGQNRFLAKSGRIYVLDPAQRDVLKPFGSNALLVGHPETRNTRKRGRQWQWLAPKNLSLPKD